MSLPVVNFANSFLNGLIAGPVGKKLMCDLNAVNAKRIRFSSNTGDPHFNFSAAFGATFFRIVRNSRSFGRASLGASLIYSSIVVGFNLGMARF